MSNDDLGNDASDVKLDTSSVSSEVVSEKKFTQEEVNSIVGGRAKEAAEKVRKEYDAKMREMQQSVNNQPSFNNQQPSSGDGQRFDPSVNLESQFESFLQKKDTERQEKAFNDHISQVANEFTGKVNNPDLKEKYEDYESVISSRKMDRYANVILMANELDNTADVYYHLLKHPEKLTSIENTAKFTDPDAAKEMIKKISSDLSRNEESKNSYRKAKEPLSRMKPGTVGVDNGKPGLADFKRMFKG